MICFCFRLSRVVCCLAGLKIRLGWRLDWVWLGWFGDLVGLSGVLRFGWV